MGGFKDSRFGVWGLDVAICFESVGGFREVGPGKVCMYVGFFFSFFFLEENILVHACR